MSEQATYIVDADTATAATEALVRAGIAFHFEPYPDEQYAVTVKADAPALVRAMLDAKVDPTPLNAAQKTAIDAYPAGDLLPRTPDSQEAIPLTSDGLLAFALRELSEGEGCDNREEALNRLARMEIDVGAMRAALAIGV